MLECRYKGQCRIEYDTDFDVCYPCIGDWGDTCAEYKPMPDVDALLRIAQVLESADKSECMGCVLEDSGCHLCVVGVEHGIAARIREALGVER